MVNVWQFDVSRQGESVLVANWSIRSNGGTELLAMNTSVISAPIEPEASYADIASAMSDSAEMLSREIANAIQEEQNLRSR